MRRVSVPAAIIAASVGGLAVAQRDDLAQLAVGEHDVAGPAELGGADEREQRGEVHVGHDHAGLRAVTAHRDRDGPAQPVVHALDRADRALAAGRGGEPVLAGRGERRAWAARGAQAAVEAQHLNRVVGAAHLVQRPQLLLERRAGRVRARDQLEVVLPAVDPRAEPRGERPAGRREPLLDRRRERVRGPVGQHDRQDQRDGQHRGEEAGERPDEHPAAELAEGGALPHSRLIPHGTQRLGRRSARVRRWRAQERARRPGDRPCGGCTRPRGPSPGSRSRG